MAPLSRYLGQAAPSRSMRSAGVPGWCHGSCAEHTLPAKSQPEVGDWLTSSNVGVPCVRFTPLTAMQLDSGTWRRKV